MMRQVYRCLMFPLPRKYNSTPYTLFVWELLDRVFNSNIIVIIVLFQRQHIQRRPPHVRSKYHRKESSIAQN